MKPRQLRAFRAEMEKQAVDFSSMDPYALAGMVAGGKIALTNALSRHGAKIRPLRWLGQEVAGVGLRTAAQGKPMLSAPLREAMAIAGDPKAVGLYETMHSAGSALRGQGLKPEGIQQMVGSVAKQHGRAFPPLAAAGDFISGIPLQSTGVRRVVDYGFTPVGQVGRDIKGLASRVATRLRHPQAHPVASPTPVPGTFTTVPPVAPRGPVKTASALAVDKKTRTQHGELRADARQEKYEGGAALANLGLAAAVYGVMKDMDGPATTQEVLERAGSMARKMGVRIDESGIAVSVPPTVSLENLSPFYAPRWQVPLIFRGAGSSREGGVVNLPRRLADSVMAHELGHALNDQVVRGMGNKWYVPYQLVETGSRTLAGALGPVALMHAAREKDPSYKGGLVNLAIASPMLLEEAIASVRAGKHLMAEHGVAKGALKTLPLVPAFATYAALAAAPLVVTHLRKKERERMAEREAKKKKAA